MPVFTAVHRALGLAPGPVDDALIGAAIEAALAESDEIEWKSELPPTKGLSEHDFPKDVAAMANAGGGVIVYGVTEDEKRATGRKDTGELDENHERTLRAAAYSAIAPPVFIDVHRIGDSEVHAVAVVVPASVGAPHLIFKDKFFGAPVRVDADTYWMKEPQIEAKYRARFDERSRAVDRLDALHDEALRNMADPTKAAWLIAVAHPRLPSALPERPTREDARKLLSSARDLALVYAGSGAIHPIASVDHLNPRPGLRRWVAVNTAVSEKTEWRSAWAAVHWDGSVTLTGSVGGHRLSNGSYALPEAVESSAIEASIADLMALIRTTAEVAGTSEYEVRISIEHRSRRPLVIWTVDNMGFAYDGTSIPLAAYSPVYTTVIADTDPDSFFWQVHDLAEDCVNQGGVTNLRHVSPPNPRA
jgi:hypothetical protein